MNRNISTISTFTSLGFILFASIVSQGECTTAKHAKTKMIHVAAASSMTFALNDISKIYKKKYPNIQLRFSYSSSGNLFAKIKKGAPYDIFLSADNTYTQQLVKSNIGIPHSRRTYAKGGLVLLFAQTEKWKKLYHTLNNSPTSAQPKAQLKTQPKAILTTAQINKIAIANPKHAPYGKAAKKWLTDAQLWSSIKPKLVYADNANGVAQYTQTLTDIGITASSLVHSPRFNKRTQFFIRIDGTHNIEHEMLILKDSQQVKRFGLFLLSTPAQNILKKHGFF